MSRINSYHLVFNDNEWQLKKAGEENPLERFRTKKLGIDYCKKYLREVTGSLKIHKKNGQFQEERTYPRNRDPRVSKG